MVARLKLKVIDGGSHKRWRMFFNSKQREEPYRGLNRWVNPMKVGLLNRNPVEVLHGCRQLVS
jgi:hypothetical protein